MQNPPSMQVLGMNGWYDDTVKYVAIVLTTSTQNNIHFQKIKCPWKCSKCRMDTDNKHLSRFGASFVPMPHIRIIYMLSLLPAFTIISAASDANAIWAASTTIWLRRLNAKGHDEKDIYVNFMHAFQAETCG